MAGEDLSRHQVPRQPLDDQRGSGRIRLLGLLEDQENGSRARADGKTPRERQKRRGVGVVTTGVHDAGVSGCVRGAARLMDGDRVHVRAEADSGRNAGRPHDDGDAGGRGPEGLEAHLTEKPLDVARRPSLCMPQLWAAVDRPAYPAKEVQFRPGAGAVIVHLRLVAPELARGVTGRFR
jgi:hypothetical protein